MHENENFFKQHKIILILFVLSFIVFLITAFLSDRGAFFDIPAHFFAITNRILDNNTTDWVCLVDCRARNFTNFLLAIPFNFAMLFQIFQIKDLVTMLNLFTTSYYLMAFLGLILNYIVALRTKRFDIAVLALLFYSFFIIPNAVWATREINLATMLQFALMSYFLSREKLNKIDILPITLLLLYLFESFETSIFIGLVLFVSSLFYLKKDNNEYNSRFKLYMGLVGLAVSIYIPLKTLQLSLLETSDFNLAISTQQWISGMTVLMQNLFRGCLIITFAGIFISIFAIFYKKPLIKKDSLILIPFVLLVALILFIKTKFIPDPQIELHIYLLSVILIFPFMLILVICDYFNFKFQVINKYFYSNLLVIACIIGIMHFGWQINSSFYCKKYVNYYKNLLINSKEPIVIQPKKEANQDFLVYDNCFGTLHRSLLFSPNHKVKTLIFPDPNADNYNEFCFEGKDKTFFAENTGRIVLQTTSFKVKNDYWDLSDIVTEFKKQNRVGRE